MGTEAQLQTKILKLIHGLPGCWAVKFPGINVRGVPDIIGCCHGKFFAFEVKRPGKKPTPIQTATMSMIHDAGGTVGVVTSLEDVLHIFHISLGELYVRQTS